MERIPVLAVISEHPAQLPGKGKVLPPNPETAADFVPVNPLPCVGACPRGARPFLVSSGLGGILPASSPGVRSLPKPLWRIWLRSSFPLRLYLVAVIPIARIAGLGREEPLLRLNASPGGPSPCRLVAIPGIIGLEAGLVILFSDVFFRFGFGALSPAFLLVLGYLQVAHGLDHLFPCTAALHGIAVYLNWRAFRHLGVDVPAGKGTP